MNAMNAWTTVKITRRTDVYGGPVYSVIHPDGGVYRSNIGSMQIACETASRIEARNLEYGIK